MMTSEKITTYSIMEWTFKIISFLMGIIAGCCFFVFVSEIRDLSLSKEFLIRFGAIISFFIFIALTVLFSSLSKLYKNRIKTILNRIDKRARFQTEMAYTKSELELARKIRKAKEKEQLNIDIKL